MSLPTPKSPDCYLVLPGKFLAGEYPGHPDDAEAKRKLKALVGAGIRVFVDLTEEGELRPYAQLLEALSEPAEQVEHHRLPIRDVSVPTKARMLQIQSVIRDALESGRPVYVHCWGGTGRTGTGDGGRVLSGGAGAFRAPATDPGATVDMREEPAAVAGYA